MHSLFNQTDITEQVLELTEQTKKNIYEFKQIDSNMTPEIPIGPHCSSHLIVLPKAIVLMQTLYLI